jgi:hypothetical protein
VVDKSIIAMGERYVVRFMRHKGSYPADDFLNRECDEAIRARFVALAKRMADFGRLPSEIHGHQLRGKYATLFEFKPHGARLFAFFHETNLYVTSGAPKRKDRAQEKDYEVALGLRSDFYAQL